MNYNNKRKSWDTAVKHYYRLGLEANLPKELNSLVASTNKSRWRQEQENKYIGCDLADFIKEEIDLIKRINQSSNIKKINESYFKLADVFHEVISNMKGVKALMKNQKELIVNTILEVKESIPTNHALKIFNLSRSTFENYKSICIHKCEASYFKWCTKRFVNQLLPKEVENIKKYLTHNDYQFWSKSSVYLKAVRDQTLTCSMATFYKYCRLLGFKNRPRKRKSDSYNPVKTSKPNELWCADVTVFKTDDGVKHYIHFLIDHYSKMILGYRIEKFSSAKAIRDLLLEARIKYEPERLNLLTDGGSENVNNTVSYFLNSLAIETNHNIAQKDVVFSNSMIEAVNKVMKHQFLYHKNTSSKKMLLKATQESVFIYNTERPQMRMDGNTPYETFNGSTIDFNKYKTAFTTQKAIRVNQNKKNACKNCF